MPDAGQLVVLVVMGLPVAAFIAMPLLRRDAPPPAADGEQESLELRRRVAYESIRGLDNDLATGGITPEQYATLRADAEERAAAALAELDAAKARAPQNTVEEPGRSVGHRAAALAGLGVAAVLLAGFVLPPPFSLANQTVVDEELAQAIAAEEERRDRIDRLSARVAANPRDTEALSDLADAHLAGSARDDLINGALALFALIDLEPDRLDAYTRLITAYIRAEDYTNAAAATDTLERRAPDSVDVPFFRGLIALRGDGDRDAAVTAFDRFLELAPNDPRAAMARSLRAEAAGELPAAPGPSVEPDTPTTPETP